VMRFVFEGRDRALESAGYVRKQTACINRFVDIPEAADLECPPAISQHDAWCQRDRRDGGQPRAMPDGIR